MNKLIVASKLISGLVLGIFAAFTTFSEVSFATSDTGLIRSNYVRVEGVSKNTLERLRSALEKEAYGNGDVEIDRNTSAASFIKTGTRKPTKQEAVDPLTETENDLCDSFYMPPAKFRILKSLPKSDACVDRPTMVLADTNRQILFLCKDGKTVADYDFSMGSKGVDKKILGDKKTPLGSYPLATPRKSDPFGTFIHIGYPTPQQAKAGYTGSDVGIHGPARFFRCAGFLNAAVNWTQGCIAVSSDSFIKEIGRFIRDNRVKEISIEPLP